jgi:hypothetical protein
MSSHRTRSKTRKGRKNYTTKKRDKVFHRKGKYVRKSRKPYSKKKRGGGQKLMGYTYPGQVAVYNDSTPGGTKGPSTVTKSI